MAGYNTTMNLLTCGAQGLMYPFDQNREQRMRLTALAEAGYLGILETADLEPQRLAGAWSRP
jgi:Predicted glycosyl transferase